MTVKAMTEQHLASLSLIGGCNGSSESIHVKMPHCWKSHVAAHMNLLCRRGSQIEDFVILSVLVHEYEPTVIKMRVNIRIIKQKSVFNL